MCKVPEGPGAPPDLCLGGGGSRYPRTAHAPKYDLGSTRMGTLRGRWIVAPSVWYRVPNSWSMTDWAMVALCVCVCVCFFWRRGGAPRAPAKAAADLLLARLWWRCTGCGGLLRVARMGFWGWGMGREEGVFGSERAGSTGGGGGRWRGGERPRAASPRADAAREHQRAAAARGGARRRFGVGCTGVGAQYPTGEGRSARASDGAARERRARGRTSRCIKADEPGLSLFRARRVCRTLSLVLWIQGCEEEGRSARELLICCANENVRVEYEATQ